MLDWLLGGGAIPSMLMLCGAFYLLYLKGRPFVRPKKLIGAFRKERGTEQRGEVSPFRAVMLALAGTLGVGNIVGVANAIALGGAGAIFWMWVSALLAMVLKYAETVLAILHRRRSPDGSFFGGAIYYIRDYFATHRMARFGVWISGSFACLMILDALSMGCMIQVNAVSSAASGVWGVAPAVSGVALLCLALPTLLRGKHSVSALTEVLVPVMTAGYVILSLAVLILRRDRIGTAFSLIFSEAFEFRSAVGGVLGFLTSRAVRLGTMRGLLSNEAGCGTSPTAHAEAEAKSPAAQGVWGIFEVFVDTILLCTLTALVILVGDLPAVMMGQDPVMMTVRSYSSVLGDWAEHFFAVAIACFGYATLLCWAHYGMEALSALSRRAFWRYAYLVAFSVCTVLGAVNSSDLIWQVSDFAIAMLTSINLCMLLLMRREVERETVRFCSDEKHLDA